MSEASYERQKALYEKNLLSAAEWDQATNAHERAVTATQTAQEEVARSQAALLAAQDNLSKCRFLAPIDGVVERPQRRAG